MDWTNFGASVLKVCERWGGFQGIKRVMDAYPHTDWYVAGGVVRDVFAGVSFEPKDFDIFIAGTEIDHALYDFASIGRLGQGPFGSPRWQPNYGSGRYADFIPINRFCNGLQPCNNIVDVLNQFDFTANAVAIDLRSLAVFDPIEGARDACDKVMRAVRFDYPDEPIAFGSSLSRPLVLWCRLLHYAASLGYDIEPTTLAWIHEHDHYLPKITEFENLFFPLHANALEPLHNKFALRRS